MRKSIGIVFQEPSIDDRLTGRETLQMHANLYGLALSELFPIHGSTVPEWLQVASMFNPLTYGIDALRIAMLGEAWQPLYPLYYDLFIMIVFDVIMIAGGTVTLSRRK